MRYAFCVQHVTRTGSQMLNNALKLTKPSVQVLQIRLATLRKLYWCRVFNNRPRLRIRTRKLVDDYFLLFYLQSVVLRDFRKRLCHNINDTLQISYYTSDARNLVLCLILGGLWGDSRRSNFSWRLFVYLWMRRAPAAEVSERWVQ